MATESIRVAVVGAAGKMGREALRALTSDPSFTVVAAVVREPSGRKISDLIVGAPYDLPLDQDLDAALNRSRPDALLDLSRSEAAVAVATAALGRRIPLVSGVSGLTKVDFRQIRSLCEINATPAMVVPNFAIGAVLMMRFAELAARWIPDAEIVELHHFQKADAPSGTAMTTAARIARARRQAPTVGETSLVRAEGARGGIVDGVPIHSVRLPGLLAHQQVIFGATGEVLTIRHDASDRSVYMPGVKLCLRSVGGLRGLTIGMDALIVGVGSELPA